MGSRQGNINHKVADHRISDFSLDSVSLSFAGLVSIQDQQQQQQNEHHMHNNHHNHNLSRYKLPEPDFEFATNKASSEPPKNSAAAVLISNGQLIPQSSQPNRSPLNQIPQGTLGTYLATDHHHHHQEQQQQQRPRPRHHQMSSSMPSGQRGNPRKYHYEALGKARKHYDEGDDYDYDDEKKKKKSFGKKALNSFISPCRDCKAIQPSASVNKYSKTPQVSKYGE